MKSSLSRPFFAALAAAALCAGTAAAQPGHSHGGHQHGAPATRMPTDTERWTEADARFMTAMIGHHAQAIEMSRLAPDRAQNAAVRRLAERIINAQEDEIATMQLWLRDRNLPVPDPHAAHGAGHEGHGERMPGMLTAEQMARLEQARGAEFDPLFLQMMIQHHRGAVSMVTQLFGSYGAGQDETVFKFASDVNVDQATEIARMQRMLADLLFGSPAP